MIKFILLLSVSFASQAATLSVATETALQNALLTSVDGDTISLAPGIYSLSTTLTINKTLTLQGSGSGLVALDGAATKRVINFTGGTTKTLTLNNLQVQNGKSSDGVGGSGLLINSGTVMINNVSFKSNNSFTGDGGALANHGSVTLSRSTFGLNKVSNGSAQGSAIANLSGATLNMDYSTLKLNISPNNASVSGAIYNIGSATLSHSVLDNNIDCSGSVLSTSGGYNWQSDHSCTGFTQLTDVFNQGISGLPSSMTSVGMIQVFQPTATSVIVNKSSSLCTGFDAVGTSVPQSVRCDLGAVEYKEPAAAPSNSATSCNDDECEGSDDDDEGGIGAINISNHYFLGLFMLIFILKLYRSTLTFWRQS